MSSLKDVSLKDVSLKDVSLKDVGLKDVSLNDVVVPDLVHLIKVDLTNYNHPLNGHHLCKILLKLKELDQLKT